MAKVRKYRKLVSTPDDLGHFKYVIKWAKRGNTFAGLPYFDELAGPGGIYLELQVSDSTPEEQIQKALSEAYNERDVVAHAVRVSPKEWFVNEGFPDV